MKIKEYVRPGSIEEAYELYSENTVLIGGGAFLNLADKSIDKGIDLSALGLNDIQDHQEQIEIGAMATLRDMETSDIVRRNFSGVLSKTAASIMGVQVRNIATIGGSISGKYGFSDILTTLLALNAQVVLHKAGVMELESYLSGNFKKDILLKVIIKKNVSKADFACVRKTATDFSVLNSAAAVVEGQLRLCVGARPGMARLAKGAMCYFQGMGSSVDAGAVLAVLASEELQFGSDMKASEAYRKELCKTLVKSCVSEVLA